jgi:hypothetical protein
MEKTYTSRDKAILMGLYLSKFDTTALQELGFDGFRQAYNALGYTIGAKPNSIKNYRDEFDPYFPNGRQGWCNRELRDYCKEYLDKYSPLEFAPFTELIKSFLIQNYDVEEITKMIEKKDHTEKEYTAACGLRDRYCLFLVKNFIKKPVHCFVFNPLDSGLIFKKTERTVVQISYSTSF